jgi:hypothetical protein
MAELPLHTHPQTALGQVLRCYRAAEEEEFSVRCGLGTRNESRALPANEELRHLLTRWLAAAKQDKLAERFPDYVKALEHAIVVISKAPSAQQAIETLQAR